MPRRCGTKNFICCCQVECGIAEGIVYAIKKVMETVIDWDQCIAKLMVLGSDGAAVMLGKNNGVITLLQAQQSSMIVVHCSGHRFELAYKESIKKFLLAEKVVTLLTGLFYIYKNSALNRTSKNAYKCLGLKMLLPTGLRGQDGLVMCCKL